MICLICGYTLHTTVLLQDVLETFVFAFEDLLEIRSQGHNVNDY